MHNSTPSHPSTKIRYFYVFYEETVDYCVVLLSFRSDESEVPWDFKETNTSILKQRISSPQVGFLNASERDAETAHAGDHQASVPSVA